MFLLKICHFAAEHLCWVLIFWPYLGKAKYASVLCDEPIIWSLYFKNPFKYFNMFAQWENIKFDWVLYDMGSIKYTLFFKKKLSFTWAAIFF